MVSAGASDAIFGIIGATLALVWTRRKMFPELEAKTLRSSVVGLLVMNLVLGSSIPSIDQAAHLGGFLMGLVCGAALGRDVYSPRGLGGLFWTTVFAMVTAGACWGALTRWIAVDGTIYQFGQRVDEIAIDIAARGAQLAKQNASWDDYARSLDKHDI